VTEPIGLLASNQNIPRMSYFGRKGEKRGYSHNTTTIKAPALARESVNNSY
jgi:hypothetical protein